MRKLYWLLFFLWMSQTSLIFAENLDNCFRTAPLPISAFPFFGSPTPSEAYDSQRTHLFPYSCTAEELINKGYIQHYRQLSGFKKPYNVVVRNRDQLYVYGGSQADIDPTPPNPYVASIDADLLQEKWRVYLRENNESIAWNYSGAVAIHSNGFLYVVYSNFLKKIDPDSGKILASLNLPATDNNFSDSTYNGFIFDEKGHIITKSVNRGPECKVDGFKAFTACPSNKPSLLLHIDSEKLSILDQVLLPENVVGRISINNNYVYLPGLHLFRYKIYEGQGLVFDEIWGLVTYRIKNQTVGTSPTFLNLNNEGYVIIENNMLPSPDPISIYAISTNDSKIKAVINPFKPKIYNLHSQEISLPSVDQDNNMIFAADGRYGELAGMQLEKGPVLKMKWKKKIRNFDFTMLIGESSTRELVTTNLMLINGKLYSNLNWLSAKTGKSIVHSRYVIAGLGLTLSMGYNNRFYQLGYDGTLSEWSFSE